MGTIWIALGALLEFFGIIGFIMLAAGDVPPSYFVTYLVLSLLGIGLIVLGVHVRKRRKRKQAANAQTQAQQAAAENPSGNLNNSLRAAVGAPAGNCGLLTIDWKKPKGLIMNKRAAFTIFVDDELVDIVFFTGDAVTTVPLPGGTHKVSAPFALRKSEITVTVTNGLRTRLDLSYSRTAGNVKFTVHEQSEPVDENCVKQAIERFEGKKALVQAAYFYEKQGYTIRSLNDNSAEIVMSKAAKILYGADRAIVEAMSKKMILELQSDGSIAKRVAGKAEKTARGRSDESSI